MPHHHPVFLFCKISFSGSNGTTCSYFMSLSSRYLILFMYIFVASSSSFFGDGGVFAAIFLGLLSSLMNSIWLFKLFPSSLISASLRTINFKFLDVSENESYSIVIFSALGKETFSRSAHELKLSNPVWISFDWKTTSLSFLVHLKAPISIFFNDDGKIIFSGSCELQKAQLWISSNCEFESKVIVCKFVQYSNAFDMIIWIWEGMAAFSIFLQATTRISYSWHFFNSNLSSKFNYMGKI